MEDLEWVWEKVRILQRICDEQKKEILKLQKENELLRQQSRGETEFAQGPQRVGYARGVL